MALMRRNGLCFVFVIAFGFFANAQKFEQTGYATYYSSAFQGRHTSCGEIFDNAKYTAAHATLPFQTLVKITNLTNNKYVIVKINDRCPKYYNRIIDLSQAAAKKLDIIMAGVANVKLEVITESELNYISQCPDSILKNTSVDSLSLKSNASSRISGQNFYGLYNHGNIIPAQINHWQFNYWIEEKRKWMTLSDLFLLRVKAFMS